MMFTQQDGGLWKFDIVNHEGTIVNITVIGPIAQSSEEQGGSGKSLFKAEFSFATATLHARLFSVEWHSGKACDKALTTINLVKCFTTREAGTRPALKIFTKSQSLSVKEGETSDIDFSLNFSTAVDAGVKIVVQHQKVGGLTFDTKCRIDHTKTGACQILFGPCECIGERSETYQYRLKMTFTKEDDGLWKFDFVSHEWTIVNITVIESITSSQAHESTEPAQKEKMTTLTGSPSEEEYEDTGWMEQVQCDVQSSMTATSRDVQSGHHLEQTTETSGSLKEEETIDFRKSVETDADSVTSTATTPSTPELPPRLYT
ncbi:hypothetical protein C0Q70_12465 [Pomacea canaliculata]|uniref:Uncharacterized protein n=1 Tax=Pomacea canaliculata TaxID=400727 RepID=A0A2T7P1L0_POMCA|nr:hypothetical protein C0Q70_12465 [Pomacea canaliculata]